jgi:acetate kinase
VSCVGPDTLLALQRCSRFLPEQNDALYRLAELGTTALPETDHLLFCDTAFFVDLPEHVYTYALPLSLADPSLRRYGGFGLCHQWVWETLQGLSPVPPSAVVSVYLGEVPNLAAIKHGRAVETSIGFTPVEGVSSARSSGDVDPTIVFQLHAAGHGLDEIARMLTVESGFSTLLGRACTLAEILQNREGDPKLGEARTFLVYQIQKYLGALISVLGDADAIAFVTEDLATYGDLIRSLSQGMGYLSVRMASARARSESVVQLTQDDSRVQMYTLHYDRWKALSERGLAYLRDPDRSRLPPQ